jgi:branched-chain amino acid transport system substrate-binding protein
MRPNPAIKRALLPAMLLFLSVAYFLGATTSVLAQDSRKVALVIGNGAYRTRSVSRLNNPPNDARDVSIALEQIGFNVHTVIDGTHEEMGLALTEFGRDLSRAEVGLFYFAGHGIQVNGSNYLIPVDVDLPNASVVPFRTIAADEILAFMEESETTLNMFFLDACRDNPLPQVSRSIDRGLAVARIRPPETMIVYATSAGNTADDGTGRNSPFTRAFLANIATPGQDVYDLFRSISVDVQNATGGQQRPEYYGNVTVRYSLVPGNDGYTGTARRNSVGESIHVALSAPITGDWSVYGTSFQRSVEMAIDMINAEGGVLGGRRFRLSVGDTRGNPTQAAALARNWTSDETIVAEIGAFSSSSSIAAQPVYNAAGMVQLSPTASHRDFANGSPWSFGMVGTQAGEGSFFAAFAYYDLGLRRIAILHINNDWGIDTAKYFSDAFKALGGEIVRTEFFFDGERNFTSVLTRLKNSRADGLFLATFYDDGAAISIERDRLNWDVTVLGPTSMYSPRLIPLGGESVEGLYTATSFFAEKRDPSIRTFVEGYIARYGYRPNFHDALAYDAMFVLADAVERAGSTDRGAIRDALARTRSFPGISGSISFSERGEAEKDYCRLVVENGRFISLE